MFVFSVLEAYAADIIKKRLMSFLFEKIPCISLGCMLVPVQYRESGYGLPWSPLTDALGNSFFYQKVFLD